MNSGAPAPLRLRLARPAASASLPCFPPSPAPSTPAPPYTHKAPSHPWVTVFPCPHPRPAANPAAARAAPCAADEAAAAQLPQNQQETPAAIPAPLTEAQQPGPEQSQGPLKALPGQQPARQQAQGSCEAPGIDSCSGGDPAAVSAQLRERVAERVSWLGWLGWLGWKGGRGTEAVVGPSEPGAWRSGSSSGALCAAGGWGGRSWSGCVWAATVRRVGGAAAQGPVACACVVQVGPEVLDRLVELMRPLALASEDGSSASGSGSGSGSAVGEEGLPGAGSRGPTKAP